MHPPHEPARDPRARPRPRRIGLSRMRRRSPVRPLRDRDARGGRRGTGGCRYRTGALGPVDGGRSRAVLGRGGHPGPTWHRALARRRHHPRCASGHGLRLRDRARLRRGRYERRLRHRPRSGGQRPGCSRLLPWHRHHAGHAHEVRASCHARSRPQLLSDRPDRVRARALGARGARIALPRASVERAGPLDRRRQRRPRGQGRPRGDHRRSSRSARALGRRRRLRSRRRRA